MSDNTDTAGGVPLKPCPFCAGTKFHTNTRAKGYFIKKQMEREKRDTSNYLIRCTKCGAKGPLKHSAQEAADAWNARLTPPPARGDRNV
jgi:Lar family restriction alleviation protein